MEKSIDFWNIFFATDATDCALKTKWPIGRGLDAEFSADKLESRPQTEVGNLLS